MSMITRNPGAALPGFLPAGRFRFRRLWSCISLPPARVSSLGIIISIVPRARPAVLLHNGLPFFRGGPEDLRRRFCLFGILTAGRLFPTRLDATFELRFFGLGGRIRTYDLLVPDQICYRYTTPSLLVSALRFELRPAGTQPAMLPLHHGTDLEPARGLEPPTLRLQDESSTNLSYAGLERPGRIELPLPPWQGGVIPLDHRRLVDLLGPEPGSAV